MVEEKLEKVERLPAALTAQMLEKEDGLFLNVARFEHAQRVATMLSASSMVPKEFQGNVGNCLIALNLAQRMRLDVFMLMQSIYVIHGRPGLEGKLVIALIEGHGRFGPLHFKFSGTGKTGKEIDRPESCVAYALDLKSKETIEGPEVTWKMVTAEGWNKPKSYRDGSGEMPSKWETMPQLMFMYRSASFFGKVHDPASLMGFQSREEIEDVEEINITPVSPKESQTEVAAKIRQDAYQKFCDSIPKEIAGTDLFINFLEATAKANRVSKDDLMVNAACDLERFWGAYRKWEEKNKPKEKQKREAGEIKTSGEPEGKEEKAESHPGTTEAPNPPPPVEEPRQPELTAVPKTNGNPILPPLERVRHLEKQYPDLFKLACDAEQIAYPTSEPAALIIERKMRELYGKGKKNTVR